MDKSELTKEEKNAIASLKRLAKRWPSSLRLICVDGGDLAIVKRGISDRDFMDSVDIDVQPCAMLRDIHGEHNEFGKKPIR